MWVDDKREVELVWNGKTGEVCNIVVDKGPIVKVTKDAKGIITREVLTQEWTGDFVFENEWPSFRTKKDRRWN